MTLSLFDTANKRIVDVYLAFYDREEMTNPWWRLIKPGFRHVEIWKTNGLFWLRVNPCTEYTDVTADYGPPWVSLASLKPTILHVRRAVPANKAHTLFTAGPVTCVEIAKAFIGLDDFLVRTPWQLYKKLKRTT